MNIEPHDGISREKRKLRSRMKELRDLLPVEERERIDAGITENVMRSSWYQSATVLFTYLSMGAEVDTRKVIIDAWAHGKLVAIPRVIPGTQLMEWYVIKDFDCLEKSSFGIDEPLADDASRIVPDSMGAGALALVPAYSFDEEGFRLGYGGGFYDEFLSGFSGISMGLCRRVQLSPHPLPRREGDVAVDIVVTESGEGGCRRARRDWRQRAAMLEERVESKRWDRR